MQTIEEKQYHAIGWLVLPLLLAGMAIRAHSQDPAPSADDLANGKRLFEGQCARCHGIKGEGGTGANLKRPVLRHAPTDKDLFAVIRAGIPGTAMPRIFAMTDSEAWQVIGYVRSLGQAASEPIPGDPKMGQLLYAKQQCAQCHIVDGKGGSMGPDLSDIGARRGLAFLRNAVLHPGQEMSLNAEGYRAYMMVIAVTREGRVVKGVRVNEDTFTIQLRDEENRLHSLEKSGIEELAKTDGSIMPDYEKTLSRTDLDNLISYLAHLRGKP